ncbi:GNAT family N-acetyltransferase [uncultured Tateyamaria sp.]|uniref:GNAT family N-acetyltransferase n=1 Tax=uncultured Tateyamaria sp. TaxID=455651 RepID=UPI00260B37F0|nr:GNAT family N-acetyltransferase [uncultured Tateyamaria sp.]
MLSDGFHDVPPGKVAMVVTYLEMRAPQSRGASLPAGLEFVELKPDVATYRDLFRRVGEDWLWYGRTLLSDAALAAILEDPLVRLFTLMKDGRAEALLELDFREGGACELAYFGLTPALIGSGAGAYLMDRAVEHAFAAPIERFHVHTCSIDSPQALSFYQRSGFVPVMQKIEIDDDPRVAHGYDRSLAPHVPIIDP